MAKPRIREDDTPYKDDVRQWRVDFQDGRRAIFVIANFEIERVQGGLPMLLRYYIARTLVSADPWRRDLLRAA